MKNIFVPVVAALVFLSVLLVNCTKQTDYAPSMAGTIDTIAFSASGAGIVATTNTTATPSQLIMTGTTTVFTPGTTFTPAIRITVATTIGTHNINNDASATVYTSATGSIGTNAVSGQINVLNNASGKIQGNFTLTCADGTKVTNGQFTTSY